MKNVIHFIKQNKAIFILLGISLISYSLGFFFNSIVSHYLRADVYGDFSITMRIVIVIGMVLLVGTNVSSVKYLSNYSDIGNYLGFKQFINWNVKLLRVTSIGSIIIFVLFYATLILLHLLTIKNITSYHYSVYAFFIAPLSAACVLLTSFMLSIKWNNAYLFFEKMSQNILLSLFVIGSLFFFEITIDYFSALIFLCMSFSIIFVAELILVWRIIKKKELNKGPMAVNIAPAPEEKKIWMKDSLNFISAQLVYRLIFIIDLLIIEWIIPNDQATGYYAAMLVIVGVLLEAPRSITSFLAPRISPLLKQKNYMELQKLINKVSLISFLVSVLFFLLIVFLSNYLLSLFGKDFTQAQIPLIVLSFAYFIGATCLSNAKILMFMDSKIILLINVSELIILIVSGVVLTYFYGLIGMSFSVLISSLAKTIIMFIKVKERLPIKPYGFI